MNKETVLSLLAAHCANVYPALLYMRSLRIVASQELRGESQPIKHPAAGSALQTIQKLTSMNVNPSSIARDRTVSRRELPNNLRRAPRKTIGFCTPDEKFHRTMQNVNQKGATTSIVMRADPLRQNSKIPERQPISPRKPPTSSDTDMLRKTPGGNCAQHALTAEIPKNVPARSGITQSRIKTHESRARISA